MMTIYQRLKKFYSLKEEILQIEKQLGNCDHIIQQSMLENAKRLEPEVNKLFIDSKKLETNLRLLKTEKVFNSLQT